MGQSDSGDDLQWGVVGGSGENKEAVTENIILVNRQRQVRAKHHLHHGPHPA